MSGIAGSGAGTRLYYYNNTSLNISERILWYGFTFNITLNITKDFMVYVNNSLLLQSGKSINYTYNVIREYTNHHLNERCLINYIYTTKVTNYGMWEKQKIKFTRITIDLNDEILLYNELRLGCSYKSNPHRRVSEGVGAV